jgi:geranylgeranyl diphosphate synthase type II
MIAGQVLDLQNEKNSLANEKSLNNVYLNKTVKMIVAPLLCASTLANNKFYDELKGYGENLGYAFQIQDDVIDVEGDFNQIGKTPNKDEQADKLTSIKIYGIDGAKQKAQEYFANALQSIKKLEKNDFFVEFANMLNKRRF